MCCHAHLVQAAIQLDCELLVAGARGRRQRPDHQHAPRGQDSQPVAAQVAQSSLDQVAGDGRAHGSGHDEPHAGPGRGGPVQGRTGRSPEVDDHQLTAAATAPAYDLPEMNGRGQAVAGGEHACVAARAPASGGEAVAALATTGGQDGATGAGAHPQAEPVGLVPAPVVRLERALAQRIHSTRGGWCNSPVTGSCRARLIASWVGGQLAPLAHETTCGIALSWTCGTGRRRCRPANGTRCAITGSIRPQRGRVTRRTVCSAATRRCLGTTGPVPVDNRLIHRDASC